MIAESGFEIGSTHEVCEDYAIGKDDWTILSDGCSNGGGPRIHTDWGSRILCSAGLQHLDSMTNMQMFMTAVGSTARTQCQVFPLIPENCLTATLMGQKRFGDNIHQFCIGDGIMGGKRKDGRWKIHTIDFLKGGNTDRKAPFYLKYKFCDEVKTYLDMFGGNYEVTTYFGKLLSPDVPDYPEEPPTENDAWLAFQADRQAQWAQTMTETAKQYNVVESPYFEAEFPVDEYEFTFQISDGGESFRWYRKTQTGRSKEEIHVLDVLRIMLNLQNFSPSFLRRAINWNFKTHRKGTFLSRGWFHEDDVSAGVIYCGESE